MTKTVVVNSSTDRSYDRLFPGWSVLHEDSSDSPYIPWDDVDMVLLVGHLSDVDPNLYGEAPHPSVIYVDKLQDLEAMRFIGKAEDRFIPVIGICKGAQQLCVYHGGKLVQDVPLVSDHLVRVDGEFLEVPADHHQVMIPPKEAEILGENVEESYPEVVRYEEAHLGIQFHPEWAKKDSPVRVWFQQCVEELL